MRLALVDDTDAVEPLSLEDVQLQVRIPVGQAHPENDYISDIIIPAVRDRAETLTNRALRQAIYEVTLDHWTTDDLWLELPKPPLVEVISVTYVDTDGDDVLLDTTAYRVEESIGKARGRIQPIFESVWPTLRDQSGAVTIRFLAGYSALPVTVVGQPLPAALKLAMLIDAAGHFENREDAADVPMPSRVRRMLTSYKSWPTQPGA